MAHQYVYTMHRLGKSYGPGQEVLKDISLSFLPGAKIGVLGLNGAGKSTLLKIMAGELTDFTGEAFLSDGLTVGYLPQEPQLNPAKTVRGNVEEGVADHKGLLKAYDEVVTSFNYGLSGDELQEAMDEQGRLQDEIAGRHGHGHPTAPAAAFVGREPVGWRAAPSGAVPADAAISRPAVAG